MGQIKYGSVCSGVEAATAAWHDLGWKPQWFSEIEKFPSAVLAHHYPDVPNFGDMTQYKDWPTNEHPIDLLVGGTPCQSFSVAGLRKGLEDPRGNLMLTYLAMAEQLKPMWLFWENVPGVLSSNGGKDFGTFLSALGQLGYGFAYRVLDAQYFNVAQRRKRVFVVGHLGDWKRAAAVLFEPESVSGHPAPSREKIESAARAIGVCTARMRGFGDYACDGSASALKARDYKDATDLVSFGSKVRRLTPTECERLQGFPDNFTQIPWRNKAAENCPDGPRYKAMGNSMAVPVMRWIGERIKKVEGTKNDRKEVHREAASVS
jgi:DNA (cytosine-5)-methyltransferase 1